MAAYILCLVGPRSLDLAEALVMVRSLTALDDGNRTQLLVLHEPSFRGLPVLRRAAAAVGRGVTAALVDLGPDPPTPRPRLPPYALGKRVEGGWSYFHMCNFFFSRVFSHPALAAAKYFMRLDSDSCFHGRIPNVFRLLDERPDVSYIANDDNHDCNELVRGLRALTLDFAKSHNLSLREGVGAKGFPPGANCLRGYYNNLEVVRLDAFRRSEVFEEWSRVVTASQGIYRHRWGDAILRRLSLNLMNARVLRISQIAPDAQYCHPCFGKRELSYTTHMVNGKKRQDYKVHCGHGRAYEPISMGVEHFFPSANSESLRPVYSELGFANSSERTCICKKGKSKRSTGLI
ncbi:hypothetical protein AB1Y20_005301 [Prymnesium parvum]|uniref:Hexosyltransferase n=1 Tax=Prymnesium parvum TaxID=97485 RepID=A0AB34J472_PRYPA